MEIRSTHSLAVMKMILERGWVKRVATFSGLLRSEIDIYPPLICHPWPEVLAWNAYTLGGTYPSMTLEAR